MPSDPRAQFGPLARYLIILSNTYSAFVSSDTPSVKLVSTIVFETRPLPCSSFPDVLVRLCDVRGLYANNSTSRVYILALCSESPRLHSTLNHHVSLGEQPVSSVLTFFQVTTAFSPNPTEPQQAIDYCTILELLEFTCIAFTTQPRVNRQICKGSQHWSTRLRQRCDRKCSPWVPHLPFVWNAAFCRRQSVRYRVWVQFLPRNRVESGSEFFLEWVASRLPRWQAVTVGHGRETSVVCA